jgi:hypothetical protein
MVGSTREHDPVDRMAVAQEVSRGRLPGERLLQWLGRSGTPLADYEFSELTISTENFAVEREAM